MAILTPSTPPNSPGSPRSPRSPRSARSSARSTGPDASLRATASAWLEHPMADVVLVTVPAVLLLGLGTLMVWSASTVVSYTQFGDAFYFVTRHAVFLVPSLVAAWLVAKLPTEKLRRLGWLGYAIAGLLLALTFTPLGYGVGGNKNWLNFGGPGSMIRLQPSEFAKLAVIVWSASVLVNKKKLLEQPKHLMVPVVPLSVLLIALVILQRDLGTAVILGALLVAVLWCVGTPWRVLGMLLGGVAAGAAALVVSNQHRVSRILGFLDPTADPTGINHQPLQALYGLATGGWWGVGLGASRQKWGSLSQAHTDYVLAIIGEELGLVGTLCVLALFFVLGFGGIRIALRSSTLFSRLVASGITSWFMIQALINVMVVLRLLPVLGVPLPFVSYGGSALLANMMALGVLVSCAREEPDARAWLARRTTKKTRPRGRLSTVIPASRRGAQGR